MHKKTSIKNHLIFALALLSINFVHATEVSINNYPAQKISPSIYIIHGPTSVPNETNQGFMNNPGIVLTSKGVVIIDPGATVQSAQLVLDTVKTLTKDPVVAIFNTHRHADHWFGNATINQQYPNIPIYADKVTIQESQIIGEEWRQTLKQLAKINDLGSSIHVANTTVKDGDMIKIGDTTFKIYHHQRTHTTSDIMIAVNNNEALFTGDNLFNGRINQHEGGHIKNTFDFVEKIVNQLQPKVIVPGHGASGGKQMVKHSLDAHRLLYDSVTKQYAEELSDFEMRPTIEAILYDYKGWEEFDNMLGKVINKAFLEVEEADF